VFNVPFEVFNSFLQVVGDDFSFYAVCGSKHKKHFEDFVDSFFLVLGRCGFDPSNYRQLFYVVFLDF
jgi:hypothetical protein